MKSPNRRILHIIILAVVLTASIACRDKATAPDVVKKQLVYKNVGSDKLLLHIFEPSRHRPDRPLPAIVFFHGGGWFAGKPDSFYPYCRDLASRGLITISAQYRYNADPNTPPYECIEDAKSAVRYVRANSDKFGIDPDKIAAAGGSAGGHLALCTSVFDKFDDEKEDQNISSKPNAIVLFSSAFDTTPNGFSAHILEKLQKQLIWVHREAAEQISPPHHVKENIAPCLILHATGDTVVPLETAERFCELSKQKGNLCQLVPFEGGSHVFYLYKEEADSIAFDWAVSEIEKFLTSLNFF